MISKEEYTAQIQAILAQTETDLVSLYDQIVVPPDPGPTPPALPTVTIAPIGSVSVGSTVTVNVSTVVDPTLTVSSVTLAANSGSFTGGPSTFQWTGFVAGSNTVTATVKDSANQTATDTEQVTVAQQPPPPNTGDGGGTDGAAPVGTTETVQGIKFTYGGPKWIWINDTSSNGTAFKKPGYSTFIGGLLGGGTGVDIGGNMAIMDSVIGQMVTKYKLNNRGVFVGHSSGASILEKAIRGQYNPTAAASLVNRYYGLGLSGVAWRCRDQQIYIPGVPLAPIPWPANIRRVWSFSGVQHDPINRHAVGGADESPDGTTQTMSMTITEFWHHIQTMFGFGVPIGSVTRLLDRNMTSVYILDKTDGNKHARCVVTPGEGHVLVSTKINSPVDFWNTMET